MNAKALVSLCSAEPEIDKIINKISGGEQATINTKIENMLNNEKHGIHLHSHSMFPSENRPKVNPTKIQDISTFIKIIHRHVLTYRKTPSFNYLKRELHQII